MTTTAQAVAGLPEGTSEALKAILDGLLSSPGGGGGLELVRVTVSFEDITFGTPGDVMTTAPLVILAEGDVLVDVGIVVTLPFDDGFGGSFTVKDGSQELALSSAVNYGDPVVSAGGLLVWNKSAVTPKSVVAVGDGVTVVLATDGYNADGTEGLADVYLLICRVASLVTP